MRMQVVLALLGGVVAAILIVLIVNGQETEVAPAVPLATGRTPAFYEFGEQSARQDALQKSLDVLTSGAAHSLGAHKDDIALLCVDPLVREKVLAACVARWNISQYEAAAFADIFMLVKAPEFVAPALRVFEHPDFGVRSKGPQVAATQAHPSLTRALLRFYEELDREHPGEGSQTRLGLIGAAAACGGDEFVMVLERGLMDSNPNVCCAALDWLATHGASSFRSPLLKLRASPLLAVRLRALLCLGREFSEELERNLAEALSGDAGPEQSYAIELILSGKRKILLPALRALRERVPEPQLGMILTSCALLGDSDVLAEMRSQLQNAESGTRKRWLALQVLAAAGGEEDLRNMEDALRKRHSGDALAAASGFNARGTACPLGILDILLDGDISHPGQVSSMIQELGDKALPSVERLLQQTTDPSRGAFLIGVAGIVASPAARALVVRQHERFAQLSEQQLRLLDLAARRAGTSH
jgi:hypothetical protein